MSQNISFWHYWISKSGAHSVTKWLLLKFGYTDWRTLIAGGSISRDDLQLNKIGFDQKRKYGFISMSWNSWNNILVKLEDSHKVILPPIIFFFSPSLQASFCFIFLIFVCTHCQTKVNFYNSCLCDLSYDSFLFLPLSLFNSIAVTICIYPS